MSDGDTANQNCTFYTRNIALRMAAVATEASWREHCE
jgi:hypothetical protein